MTDFFLVLCSYQFLQNALIAGILASLVCGVIGTFVVVKKITLISGGIAHAILGGVGIAYYFSFNTLWGALLFAILSAVVIGITSLYAKESEDTIISILWVFGMALGLLFIYLTPGYNVDLLTYLFGNILLVSKTDIYILTGLTFVILTVVFVFYRQFIAISFDDEFASLRNIKVPIVYILLLCLISFSIVVLMRVVGLILVIALLTLPAATSAIITKRVSQMIFVSIIFAHIFIISGIVLAFKVNVPPSVLIVLIAVFSYVLTVVIKKIKSN